MNNPLFSILNLRYFRKPLGLKPLGSSVTNYGYLPRGFECRGGNTSTNRDVAATTLVMDY